MSSRTKLWVVRRGSDNVRLFPSLPVSSDFTGRSPSEVSLPCPCLNSSLCLHAQLHLSSYSALHLLVVILSASLLWLHPHPLMLRGGHSMPLMWPWPHVPPACPADPETVCPSSTLCDWWQGCPLLSPSMPPPWLEDSITFHELICLAPRSCTSNAGTTLVSSRTTPWGTQSMCDLPLPGLQPHLHTALQHPYCIITVSILNPSDSQT